MIRSIVPFQAWHLAWLKESGLAEGGDFEVGREIVQGLERQNSWTAVVDDEPIACGGTVLIWPGRNSAWAYLNVKSAQHMLFLTRCAEIVLAKAQGRIEMTVRIDFDAGHRWARMLGFHIETPYLVAYGPEHEPHRGYLRYNTWLG